MSSIRTRAIRTALAAALLPALLATGCGDDEDKKLPPVDDTDSSSSTDTVNGDDSGDGKDKEANDSGGGGKDTDPKQPSRPDGIKLSRDEQAAFDKALKDYAKWGRIWARLTRKPDASRSTKWTIVRHTFKPVSDAAWRSLQRYEKAGVRILGQNPRIRWNVPVKADLDAKIGDQLSPLIVFKRCTIRSDSFRVMHNGKELEQPKDYARRAAKVTVRADPQGYWRPTREKDLGQC